MTNWKAVTSVEYRTIRRGRDGNPTKQKWVLGLECGHTMLRTRRTIDAPKHSRCNTCAAEARKAN